MLLAACSQLNLPEPQAPTETQSAALIAATRNWFTQAGPTTTKLVAIDWSKAHTFDNWLVAPLADTTNPFAHEHKRAYRYLVAQNTAGSAFTGRIVEMVLAGKAPAGGVEQTIIAATKRLLAAPQVPASLPGITGWLLFYSPTYQYENGFVYDQGVAQAERVRLARQRRAKDKGKASQTTLSLDNEGVCLIELRCGYVNGELSNCIYVEHCLDGEGGGGGGGGWGGSGGGGSTPTSPPVPTPTTPCGALTRDGQNTQVQAKFNELKGVLTDNKEHGVGVSYDASGNPSFSLVTGQPGTAGIDIVVTSPLSSFTHTHYTGLLSIFSGSDLRSIYTLYDEHHMVDPSTFTMTVITASGTTYSLAITDATAFAAFGDKSLKDNGSFNGFEFAYSTLYNISTTNTVEQNERSFLQLLTQANTGLTLYKGDPTNFASWQKLSYNNSNQTTTSSPCN